MVPFSSGVDLDKSTSLPLEVVAGSLIVTPKTRSFQVFDRGPAATKGSTNYRAVTAVPLALWSPASWGISMPGEC